MVSWGAWCSGEARGAGRGSIGRAGGYVGGPSGPTLLSQVAGTWAQSVGPEGPPTRAARIGPDLMDEYVECW
ncbi:DUF6053 domain-containing protein [Lysobacter enzymogenes]|uniref:DUF6053 domain-containing protein n=1 Tax=Lysobacter enzymogenes TaxID=69 RepID=UPI003CCD90C5